ncbi:XkdW family protein [Paenibacillus alba]|uniref:XkdW family protein n=1 Tax=Paenibacillus alba TaxID=1197127 RepID=A0ABU6GAQ8_9BACL|nr:XkdW family protein [Paenibacillus alba]MEC0231277.1 XkdW family protein [Paenibacillus alba]
MNIALAIMHLFPKANPMMDFIVQDDSDGNGAYIAQWNLEKPKPTEAELKAAWDDMQPTPEKALNDDRYSKINTLNAACNTSILGGFTSDALGENNAYDFGYDDQINLGGMLNAISAGIITDNIIWKASGVPQHHTIEQFKSVFAAGLEWKNTNIGKYLILKAQVSAATTTEEIEAISW